MDLQNAFYIIGIVFMSVMLILFIVLLTAVLVIKSKINKAHDMIDEKLSKVKSMAGKASIGINTVKYFVKKHRAA
jgi:ABC-type multidrug transport system fused ATPase/permease subunit